jgi:hypothetical protein
MPGCAGETRPAALAATAVELGAVERPAQWLARFAPLPPKIITESAMGPADANEMQHRPERAPEQG